MLSKIEHNPQRYHDFIYVLQLDGICEDAEAALALLPTGDDSTREQIDTLQPVHSLNATTQMEPKNYQGVTRKATAFPKTTQMDPEYHQIVVDRVVKGAVLKGQLDTANSNTKGTQLFEILLI